MIRKSVCFIFALLLAIYNLSFAAVVSDNDGSAFITKSEFDSLKNNFQKQVDNYNNSIDSKINGSIASYLAGINLSQRWEIKSLDKENIRFLNTNLSCSPSVGSYSLVLERQANIDAYNQITVSGGAGTYIDIPSDYEYTIQVNVGLVGSKWNYADGGLNWFAQDYGLYQTGGDGLSVGYLRIKGPAKLGNLNELINDLSNNLKSIGSGLHDLSTGTSGVPKNDLDKILCSAIQETIINYVKAGDIFDFSIKSVGTTERVATSLVGTHQWPGGSDIEQCFTKNQFRYDTSVESDPGYGLLANARDGKYYINNYTTRINTNRYINVQQHTYIDHSDIAYKSSSTAYNDDTANAVDINDSTSWEMIESGTKQDTNSVEPNATYFNSSNYFQYLKDSTKMYNMFQWGKIPSENIVVYDNLFENEVGESVTIEPQAWDRNGYYTVSVGAPAMTTDNKVKSKSITFTKNHPRYFGNNKIDYYYSDGLSQLGYGDVKIGGGLPFANVSAERDSSKVKMKFDIYDSSDTLSNSQNLHWMISDKQFVSGGFDSTASVKLEGDSTGGTQITTTSFATSPYTTLWVNVYAATSGSYVKISGLSVE